eukprot:15022125-Alexandrium_andersonii.AAC.1
MAAYRSHGCRSGLSARPHQRPRQVGAAPQRGSRPGHAWHCHVVHRHRAWLACVRCADCGASGVR